MHQREKIAPQLALIRMTAEHLLRVTGIDRDFAFADVVTGALERTVESHLATTAMRVERNPALGRRLGEGGPRLKIIDAGVSRFVHSEEGIGEMVL